MERESERVGKPHLFILFSYSNKIYSSSVSNEFNLMILTCIYIKTFCIHWTIQSIVHLPIKLLAS